MDGGSGATQMAALAAAAARTRGHRGGEAAHRGEEAARRRGGAAARRHLISQLLPCIVQHSGTRQMRLSAAADAASVAREGTAAAELHVKATGSDSVPGSICRRSHLELRCSAPIVSVLRVHMRLES